MKTLKVKIFFRLFFLLFSVVCISLSAQNSNYKCLLQMRNYVGEKAYVVVSLIDPAGQYEKTITVMGTDSKWYNTLKEWYKFQNKKKENLHGITRASVAGGDRSVTNLKIEDQWLNKGYKLRFESVVEDQDYYIKDVEILLNTETITSRVEGSGYIRFVKISHPK